MVATQYQRSAAKSRAVWSQSIGAAPTAASVAITVARTPGVLVHERARAAARPARRAPACEQLLRAAKVRWPVEEDFEFGEDCFGLDQSQVRLYAAIARHAVLVMAALAICAVTAASLHDRTGTQAPPPVGPDQRPPAEPGMIPLSVPQIKHLLAALPSRPRLPGHAAYWLDWRRRHQARSAWYHQRTRLARDTENPLAS